MDRPLKETMTVEFKSDRKCLPLDILYNEVVAMANTDGGIICLGIEDNGDITGVNAQHTDIVEISAKIQTHTSPSVNPHVFLEEWDGRTVLVVEVKSSRQLVMTSDGRCLRRRLQHDGSPEVIAMQPVEILQRLSQVQTIDPSAQVIEDVPAAVALNPLERERLRGMVRSFHGDSALLDLSDDELDKALDFVRIRDGVAYPTIAGILLIGHEQYIREYVPGNEVLFQVLDGVNVLVNPPAMRGPLLSIFETVNLMFRSRVTEQEIQVGLFRVPVPNYEPDAFREGFVNALVHRDYFRSGAVHVQLQNQSMFISSPGGFPEGVTADNILTVAPTPRNRILAEAVKRIGLAERTGRGVDKIYRSMLRSGHDIPDYSGSSPTWVILRLNSARLDEPFIRMLVEEERRIDTLMPIDSLIMLSVLRKERRVSLEELARRIQKETADAKTTVEWLVETGLVEAEGNSRSRGYILSSRVYSGSGNEIGYTRQKSMTINQEISMIERHVEKFGSISRSEVVELCRCEKNHAYYILRKMVGDGLLRENKRGKYTSYSKV
ncbi:MAG: putative DNA binding domain-containing protein [Spirochaetales bacterium]|nr:putative DNA binding domain-containing protein [Spirochaetales bacterium]